MRFFQAMDNGTTERYQVLFEVKAASFNQRITVQLMDYSPETNIEKLIIYDSRKAR